MSSITVKVIVKKPIDKVWTCWTKPEHITNWNFASEDWQCPNAENNLRIGGSFKYTMAAKDKSISFDFVGKYEKIEEEKVIESVLDDGRKVKVTFQETPSGVIVTEIFDAEAENPEDMQQQGWQAILNNFKSYCEKN